ncbi:MAG: acyl--CoA ligase [bacterium]|nr:acyl--CoA ligase [bacterium]
MVFKKLEKLAITQGLQPALKENDVQITFGELWERVKTQRLHASKKGLNKGMVVILSLENSIDWVSAFLTLSSLGAGVVPVSPLTTPHNLEKIKNDLKAEFVVDKANIADFFDNQQGDVTKEPPPLWPDKEEEILIHPTSGTTGQSKYCVRTLGQIYAEGESYKQTLGITPGDVILNSLPLYHSYGFGFSIPSMVAAGATLVLMKTFQPRSFLKAAAKERATLTPLVPAMARALAEVFLPEPVDVSSIRTWMVGTGKIPGAVYKKFSERFNTGLDSNYGSTETGAVVTRLKDKTYPAVGTPMPGVQLEIRDRHGRPVPASVEGFIRIRAAGMFKRYWRNPAAFDRDGYFPTGDTGYMDEKGNLFITGREKKFIDIGGKKVDPVKVEHGLMQHPKVKEAAVFPQPRSNGSHTIRALAVTTGPVTVTDLMAFCKKNMEPHMVPTEIGITGKIPRNTLGKITMENLRKSRC